MYQFEKDFISFFEKVGQNLGMDGLPMKVFSVMFLELEDMTMDDIVAKTGYSLASISNTMKMLEGTGVVQRTKKPGSRKIYFRVERNLARMNMLKLQAAKDSMVKPAKLYFPEMIKKYKNKLKDEKSKEKFKIIEDYYEQMLEMETIMDKWRQDLENLAKKRL